MIDKKYWDIQIMLGALIATGIIVGLFLFLDIELIQSIFQIIGILVVWFSIVVFVFMFDAIFFPRKYK